jgi:hypothetical protein
LGTNVSFSVNIKGGALPGLEALRHRMEDANKSVLVGVPVGAEPEPDGTPMAMIAAVHEFGSPEQNIPERSFLRGGIRRGTPKFGKLNERNLSAVVRGTMTVAQSLGQLGAMAAGEVKREFTTADFAPIAQATIYARKRRFGKASTRPLIATGNLRQSITWVEAGAESSNARVIR